MKRIILSLSLILVCIGASAQAPQGITHQAVIREANNNLIANEDVGIRVSILQGSIDGAAIYVETHTPKSNANGLITYIIGHGDVVSGLFEEIVWSNGLYFLKTEADPTGGTNYSIEGVTQFHSVPFAYHSQTSADSFHGDMENKPIINLGDPTESKDATNKEYVDNLVDMFLERIKLLEDHIGIISHTFGSVQDIDGNTYKTVVIGDQEWMAENLKVMKYNNGDPIQDGVDNSLWQSTNDGAFSIYPHDGVYGIDSEDEMRDEYGLLYNWHTVIDPRLLCPIGWEVPTDTDWTILTDYLGGYEIAGAKLSEAGNKHWINANSASNATGFTGLPAGWRQIEGDFRWIGLTANWWTSTPYEGVEERGYCRKINNHGGGGGGNYVYRGIEWRNEGYSVRCIRKYTEGSIPTITTNETAYIRQDFALSGGTVHDEQSGPILTRGVVWNTTESPATDNYLGITNDGVGIGSFDSKLEGLLPSTTYFVRAYASNSNTTFYGEQMIFTTFPEILYGDGITDADGNFYESVIIGSQEWMTNNLRTTKYKDGSSITTGLNTRSEWESATEGAFAVYPHADVDNITSDDEMLHAYGALYNGFAVTNSNGLCPTGWRASSEADWNILFDYIIEGYGLSDKESPLDEALINLKSCRMVDSPIGGYCMTTEHPRWDFQPFNYGTDVFGFGILPAAWRDSDSRFIEIGYRAIFWTTTSYGNELKIIDVLYSRISQFNKYGGFSVRCVKD